MLQLVLLLLAVVAIPWMLVPKPYLLRKRHLKRQEQLANYGRVSPQDEDGENDEESGNMRLAAAHHEEEEEFDFSEIAVHQVPFYYLPENASSLLNWQEHGRFQQGICQPQEFSSCDPVTAPLHGGVGKPQFVRS